MSYTEVHIVGHASAVHMETPEIVAGRAPYSILTEIGIRQAQALGETWAEENTNFDEAWTSPIIRAVNTLQIAQTIAGMALKGEFDPRLAEQCLGNNEGKARDDVYDPYNKWMLELQGALYRHQGRNSEGMPGESLLDVSKRMTAFIESVHTESNDEPKTIVAVSHAIPIKGMLNFIEMGGQSHSVDPLELQSRTLDLDRHTIAPCSQTLVRVENGTDPGEPVIRIEYVGKTVDV
jgi:broad specificity phosphatase PhoE